MFTLKRRLLYTVVRDVFLAEKLHYTVERDVYHEGKLHYTVELERDVFLEENYTTLLAWCLSYKKTTAHCWAWRLI